MLGNNSIQPKVSFRQKIILIILSLFLFFIILEISLRIGGFILLSLQEHRNLVSLRQKGTYRIMCLGESTTAEGYPSCLEEILNQCNIEIRFSVINAGVSGINTSCILNYLEEDLNKYNPDMVITMMGINDLGTHMPYEGFSASRVVLLLRFFRTYKLARLLWLHIVTKAKEIGFSLSEEDKDITKLSSDPSIPGLKETLSMQTNLVLPVNLSQKETNVSPRNTKAYLEWGRYHKGRGSFKEAEEAFKKAIELNPRCDDAYIGLVRIYTRQKQYAQAEELFKKMEELNLRNARIYLEKASLHKEKGEYDQAEIGFNKAIEMASTNSTVYVEAAQFYFHQDNYAKAEELLQKAIEIDPQNADAYSKLAYIYKDQKKYVRAEELFKKALELNPKDSDTCVELGCFYNEQGRHLEAEEAFNKAIELNPRNIRAYIELAWIYKEEKKNFQAEELFKKIIVIKNLKSDNSQNERAYGELAVLYSTIGKYDYANAYYTKANKSRLEYYNSMTRNNYLKLKEILDQKGIRLVCVQYPVRSVESLKKVFEGQEEGIIFIDNEKVFKDAIRKEGYRDYFLDLFGGDFGHCTRKGNRLLAKNIANVILKEYFSSR